MDVIPLAASSLTSRLPALTMLRGWGDVMVTPVWSFLIRTASSAILVDSGTPSPAVCEQRGMPVSDAGSPGLTELLAGHGIAARDIEYVVLTHLHFDHSANLGLFPRARVVLQRREFDYARQPLWVHDNYYWLDACGLQEIVDDGRLHLVDGHAELADGVRVQLTPGHTPGSQVVQVGDGPGGWLLAGDSVPLLRNIEADGRIRPGGIFVDLGAYLDSLRLIAAHAPNILPGHEPSLQAGVPIVIR
jgi:N-acyl homoserine lactone hydrolase